MGDAAGVVTLVLAVAGAITSAVALYVNRSNAKDARASADAAVDMEARQKEQSQAHTELVDALEQMGLMVDRYRLQVTETRTQLSEQARQMGVQAREMVALRTEHEECLKQVATIPGLMNRLRIAEAKIAELGG